jgi:hypothetical protein
VDSERLKAIKDSQERESSRKERLRERRRMLLERRRLNASSSCSLKIAVHIGTARTETVSEFRAHANGSPTILYFSNGI